MISRHNLSEVNNIHAVSRFNTANPVTVTLYDLSNDSVVPITSNVCAQVGTEIIYKWSFSNIITTPTTFKKYEYIMTDGVDVQSDTVVFANEIRRPTLAELGNYYANARFATGINPTIKIYDLSDDSLPLLSNNIATEVDSIGYYKWRFTDLATTPTIETPVTEYLYVMTDGVDIQAEVFRFGGENVEGGAFTEGTFHNYLNTYTNKDDWKNDFDHTIDTVLVASETAPSFETCKVNFYMFDADTLSSIDSNMLYSINEKVEAQISGPFNIDNAFFSTQKIAPASYNENNAKGFWILPRGANVKFYVSFLNINGNEAIIPNQSEIDLNTLLGI
jgi:hypothetical protein